MIIKPDIGTTVFQTDADGAFVSTYDLQSSDFDTKGVVLLPGDCVMQPPTLREGFWPVWKNGGWTLVEDHRGQTWYRGEDPVEILVLGSEVISELTDKPVAPPAKALTPDDFKLEVRRRIFAVISATAQSNLTAARAADMLTEPQKTTFKVGLLWIGAMRLKGSQLAATSTLDYQEDHHWPVLPDGVADLVAIF